MLNTFRAQVFIKRGEQTTCFIKTTDTEIDKLREYLVYIPSITLESKMIGAVLLDPELIYSEVMPEQQQDYVLDYQI